MGFFKKLFKKNSIQEESEWDKLSNDKKSLDMSDPFVREQYVMSCLDQMREASAEMDRVNGEYARVTSYLTDMEEIEALEGPQKQEIENIARHIHDLRIAHDKYVLTPSIMTDEEFRHMEKVADEAVDGLKKIRDEEDYRGKVKSDLKRIDKEKDAYNYRRHEVNASIENARGVATIAMVAAVVLIVLLFLLQVLLDLNVVIGYYISIAVIAVTITIVYVKYTDRVSEKKKIDNTINELILLENKVKIRYVNNKNLLDYLYTKYEVSSAEQLKDLLDRYLKAKEEKRSFERNEAVYEDEMDRLIRKLRNLRIKDPEIWIHQSDALYDNREMVEIRHNLIGRRQKLRKQIEYNEQIALEASDEIKEVMKDYPKAAPSLLELVNKYGQN